MDPKPAETPSMDPEVLDRANAGEEAHQLAVGKHYMVLAESGVKPEENGIKATEWLILASKQGNDTATELLCRCMDTKLGITEKNEEMIKWCLTTSSMEKKVRYAARRMFGAINKAHKDVLSKEEYLEAIKEITGDKHTRKLLVAAGKKIGDAISEDAFVKTVSKRVQGKINLTEEEAAEQTEEYRRSSIFKKILKHPITTGKVIGQQMLEIASKRGTSWLISLIPTNQIYIMLLLFIYGFITPSLVFFFVPLFFFYLSFAAMVISTLQMFYGRQKLSDTSTLTSALKNFDIGVDVESVESQFCWNSLTPYIVFFSSIIASVISFSLANKSYIPCSEVCIIALIFAVSCFIALSDSHDHLTLMTVGSNLLASLPIILDGFPNIPVLIHILKLISSPLFVFNLGFGLKLNFGLPSLSFLLLPFLFIFMARQKSWKGVYRILIPHLVCYFWWNFMTVLFSYTTWWTMLRATVGYLMLPLLVPLSVFTIGLSVIYFVIKLVQSAMFGKILTTIVLLGIPLALTQSRKILGDELDSKYRFLKRIVIFMFCVLAVIPLFFIRIPAVHDETQSELHWSSYYDNCVVKDNETTEALTATRCVHMKGIKVAWSGTVTNIKITNIENSVEKFIESLPAFLANQVRCSYGDYYNCSDESTHDTLELQHCKLMVSIGRLCHLRRYDSYSFQLQVHLEDGYSPCTLLADYRFTDQLLTLRDGDEIEFVGLIGENLAFAGPKLYLRQVSAKNRELPAMLEIAEMQDILKITLVEALSVTVRFFWFPLFEFNPEGHAY